jgi:cell division protein FtsX
MLRLSLSTVRHGWAAQAAAFVALALGVTLIALAVLVIGATEQLGTAEADDLATLFGMTATVAVFLAALATASAFALAVALRRRELGLLRLIGATPRQVKVLVIGEAAVVTAAAVLTGGLLATLLAPVTFAALRATGLVSATMHADNLAAAWGVAAGCGAGAALAGSWRAARRAGRTAPAEALREAQLDRRRPGLLQALTGLACAAGVVVAVGLTPVLTPLSALLIALFLPIVAVTGLACLGPLVFPALAGLIGRPLRTRDVAFGLAHAQVRTAARTTAGIAVPLVAVCAVVASWVITLSFTVDWTTALDREQLRAPVVVEIGNAPAVSAVEAVRADPTVARADVRRHAPAVLDLGDGGREEEELDVVDVPGAVAARGLRAVRGDLGDLHGRALAVTRTWVSDSGLRLGDHARLRVGGRWMRVKIVAVVADAPDLIGDLVVPADLRPGLQTTPDVIFVLPRGDAGRTRASLTSSLTARAGTRAPGSKVLTAQAWTAGIDRRTRQTNELVLWVLLGPATVYAGICVINAVLLGTTRRREQMRVARLLGADDRQVRRAVVGEVSLAGAAALFTGAAVCVLVAVIIRSAIVRDVPHAPLTVPWLPLLGTGLAAAVVVLGAAGLGARRV